jgi:G3E family GTPase
MAQYLAALSLEDDDSSDGEAPLLVDPAPPRPGKVPVTVLCGFLGSGKTTLLRRILENQAGLRIAVVENEFGDTRGLETLLAGATALDADGRVVELRNGCVCCSTKGELASALEGLVALAKRPLDAIVVELSGVADPGVVAAGLWLDDALESPVVLDGIVCVVDGVRGLELLRSAGPGSFEAKRAVATADRILLSKADVCDVIVLEEAVRALNPAADVRRSRRGRGDFGIDGFLVRGGRAGPPPSIPGAGWATPHDKTAWGAASATLPLPHVVDRKKLERLLGSYLWETDRETRAFRAKGAVLTAGGWALVQGVSDAFELEPTEAVFPESRLALIGVGLDPGALQAAFGACVT